jgi:hypothetical protein
MMVIDVWVMLCRWLHSNPQGVVPYCGYTDARIKICEFEHFTTVGKLLSTLTTNIPPSVSESHTSSETLLFVDTDKLKEIIVVIFLF